MPESSARPAAGRLSEHGAPWSFREVYIKCYRELPFKQWCPLLNVFYEVLDEPVGAEQLVNIWNTMALVSALLLNVMLAAPLSLSYDRLTDTNDLFGVDGPSHTAFVSLQGNDWSRMSMEGMGNKFSNRVLYWYTFATSFLSASLLITIISVIVYSSTPLHVVGNEYGAYVDWWKRCGRWLLLMQISVCIAGIVACYIFFFNMVDMTFPNDWWEAGEEHLNSFSGRALTTLRDSSAFNAGVQILIIYSFVGAAALLLSYGSASRYLIKHTYGT